MGRRSVYNIEPSAIGQYIQKFLPRKTKLPHSGIIAQMQNVALAADPSNRGRRLYEIRNGHNNGFLVSAPDDYFTIIDAVTPGEARQQGYI